mmetsp:Transcript_27264/g.65691  ORF Transcript_27264/g.65691 Transcript_27264/m.65691 type:complete len:372 (-) Transcript_27264:108-1223(-)
MPESGDELGTPLLRQRSPRSRVLVDPVTPEHRPDRYRGNSAQLREGTPVRSLPRAASRGRGREVTQDGDIKRRDRRPRNKQSSLPVVAAVCLGSSIDLEEVVAKLKGANKEEVSDVQKIDEQVCHATVWGQLCFIFKFGSLVVWGDETTSGIFRHGAVQAAVAKFASEPLGIKEQEEDDMYYKGPEAEGVTNFEVIGDTITLSTGQFSEKLACAYAFAQAVKLAVWEQGVKHSIEAAKDPIERLRRDGHIGLQHKAISQQIGNLFSQRCEVNLHTDILDTPEIFWENDRFESQYTAVRGYLDVDSRIDILNQRLEILKDLYECFQNELNTHHSNKLEWIVIWLICAEVLVEVLSPFWEAWVARYLEAWFEA